MIIFHFLHQHLFYFNKCAKIALNDKSMKKSIFKVFKQTASLFNLFMTDTSNVTNQKHFYRVKNKINYAMYFYIKYYKDQIPLFIITN